MTTQRHPRGIRLAEALGLSDVGRALRDFATYLPTQALPALAGFLVLPVLARRLSPTDLGILAIAQTLVTFGWTAVGSWLAQAIIRELPAHRARRRSGSFRRTLERALFVSAGLWLVFTAGTFLAGIGSDAIRGYAVLISVATAGLVVQNIAVSLFAASLEPLSFAAVDVTARTSGIALGVAAVFLGYGVRGYLISIACASLVVGAIGLWRSWPSDVADLDRGETRVADWFRYGFPSSAAGLLLWGLFFIDRYLLALLKDTGHVGIYSVGSIVGDKAISLPTMAFMTAAGPLLVSAFEHSGPAEVGRLMRAYTRVILLIGIPVLAFLVTSAGILVPILAGPSYYEDAGRIAPLVALGSLIYSVALVSNTGLVVERRTWPLAWSAAAGLVVNVVLNLLLIPPLGVVGAAISTPLGMGTYLIAILIMSRAHVSWRFPYATLSRAVVAAVVAATAAVFAMRTTNYGIVQMVIAAVLGGAVYVGVLAVLGERGAGATALKPGSLEPSQTEAH